MKHPISTWSIILILLLFAGSVYLGYQFANTPASKAFTRELMASFSPLRDLSSVPLLFFIFLNNSVKALLVILLGIVPFLFPVAFVTLNGLILGVVVNHTTAAKGLGFTLVGLLPHGVLELAAILLAAALGVQISFAVLAALGGKKGQVGRQYVNALTLYLKFILPALFLAAVIETVVGRYILQIKG